LLQADKQNFADSFLQWLAQFHLKVPPAAEKYLSPKELEPLLGKSIRDILPDKTARWMTHSAYRQAHTVGDLVAMSHEDVMKFRNLGWTAVKQVETALVALGFNWPGYKIPYPKGFLCPEFPKKVSKIRTSGGTYKDGYVYLMVTGHHRYIKIGFSTSPRERETTLQAEDPQMRIDFVQPANGQFERWLHERFAMTRIRGEWFDLSKEDVAWIKSGKAHQEFLS